VSSQEEWEQMIEFVTSSSKVQQILCQLIIPQQQQQQPNNNQTSTTQGSNSTNSNNNKISPAAAAGAVHTPISPNQMPFGNVQQQQQQSDHKQFHWKKGNMIGQGGFGKVYVTTSNIVRNYNNNNLYTL
jgi:hypothetical protein